MGPWRGVRGIIHDPLPRPRPVNGPLNLVHCLPGNESRSVFGSHTPLASGLLQAEVTMKLSDLKTAGHWPTLVTAFLYFDSCKRRSKSAAGSRM